MKRADRGYEAYKNAYLKREAYLSQRGYSMGEEMYSRTEWEGMYRATKNDYPDRRDINSIMVTDQSYSESKGRISSLKHYMDTMGIEYNKKTLRYWKFDEETGIWRDPVIGPLPGIPVIGPHPVRQVDWNGLRTTYSILRSGGVSVESAKLWISQEFFGSDNE